MYMSQSAPIVTTHPYVETLGQAAFDVACASLMRMVALSYSPTLLVGIRTGGLIVAEAMARSVAAPPPVMPLTCQRAGTVRKSQVPFLHQLLGLLPRAAVDALRML